MNGSAWGEVPSERFGQGESSMRSRQRKLIGTIFMLLFVVVYALVAMVVAQATAMRIESLFWRTIIFALLGLGWAVPMVPLISWMEKRDP
jgi:polyferredoxin